MWCRNAAGFSFRKGITNLAILSSNLIGQLQPSGMKHQHWQIMWIWNLKDLSRKSIQGDSIISDIFRAFNVVTEFTERGVHLTKSSDSTREHEFKFNFSDHPDIAPAVITSCAYAWNAWFIFRFKEPSA